MKLIVGLGNPGKEYIHTRHNIGFIMIEAFCSWNKIGEWKHEKSFSADILKDGEILYCKPQTYMNNSGEAVKKIMDYYKIAPENILVLHDEIDIPTGVIQKKIGGSHAGHNGIKSIINCIGTNTFTKIRIGVDRPSSKEEVVDYVLGKFSSQEIKILIEKEEAIFGMIQDFIG